jgi:hypothetical protein
LVLHESRHGWRNGSSESGIRATAAADRLHFGFHYFNDDDGVEAVLRSTTGTLTPLPRLKPTSAPVHLLLKHFAVSH